MITRVRSALGVVVLDLPRYLPKLWSGSAKWLSICNRYERLQGAPDGSAYRCDWQWTSDLHAPKILPVLGRWMMRRALTDHRIRRLPEPELVSEQSEVSFIIGHRGMTRLPHLLATLESIAAQKEGSFECLVIEQEVESQLRGRLPDWVRHIHTPPPVADMPYCRAWTFNIGAKHARGRVLVLHDNDMLVPEDYASQILARVDQGYEVVNLKRFIFYLNQEHTQTVLAGQALLIDQAPEAIMQNSEAGGSIAITSTAYERIGGMDESFIGWGGEDNEFWERAQTCGVWSYGYLPLVHLWHPAQPGKCQGTNPMLQHYRDLSAIPVSERIGRLRNSNHGDIAGPIGYAHDGV